MTSASRKKSTLDSRKCKKKYMALKRKLLCEQQQMKHPAKAPQSDAHATNIIACVSHPYNKRITLTHTRRQDNNTV
jgi:hypothetical protein